jgi:hypothetical protein
MTSKLRNPELSMNVTPEKVDHERPLSVDGRVEASTQCVLARHVDLARQPNTPSASVVTPNSVDDETRAYFT